MLPAVAHPSPSPSAVLLRRQTGLSLLTKLAPGAPRPGFPPGYRRFSSSSSSYPPSCYSGLFHQQTLFPMYKRPYLIDFKNNSWLMFSSFPHFKTCCIVGEMLPGAACQKLESTHFVCSIIHMSSICVSIFLHIYQSINPSFTYLCLSSTCLCLLIYPCIYLYLIYHSLIYHLLIYLCLFVNPSSIYLSSELLV